MSTSTGAEPPQPWRAAHARNSGVPVGARLGENMVKHLVWGSVVAVGVAGLALAPLGSQSPRAAIQLAPCAVDARQGAAECGHLSVPENRSITSGRRIDVHVVVVRASRPGARNAVFMLAGGPGQGGAGMAGQAYGWAAPVRADQDLVFMDQRGTGESHPLSCPPVAAADPAAAFGHVFDPARVKPCRVGLEADADLTQYTTDAAVADMEDIRAALGYERLSLVGGSYGTRLAQAYLRRHPDRVAAVVLDGVVPFDRVVPLTYARSAQQSLDRIVAACAADAACRAASPHPAQDLDALLRRLARGPVPARIKTRNGQTVAVKMSPGDLGYAIRGMLYAGGAMTTLLPAMLSRAASSGDVSEFAQRYFDREAGMEASIALGLHLSVFCAEDLPFAPESEVGAATAGTFLGRYLFDEYRRACEAWPRGRVAPDARTPVTARVPVLLVSGFFDPVTPPEFAQSVARPLPLARTIVAPTAGHGATGGCARAAVLHVLVKRTLEGLPEVCK